MIATDVSESVVEQATLAWFEALGYEVCSGADLSDGPAPERQAHTQVVLFDRLREALIRLNPTAPLDMVDQAARQISQLTSPSLIMNNHTFHTMLANGLELDRFLPDGSTTGIHLQLADFANVDNNDWLVANQLMVVEGHHARRPDVVVFLNGLPVAVFELKDPADSKATIWSAFNQLQTYKQQIPSLMAYNEVLVISDGIDARIGSLTADRERFMPWRTVEGEELAPVAIPQLHVLVDGVFAKRRFLEFLRHFIVFETEGPNLQKKLAAYHQFHAVNRAVEETVRATGAGQNRGDRRVGVIWHTQGSGKSLTMVFYAGRVVVHSDMRNPTLVVLTDRNDLDQQLFGTFSRCQELLKQEPEQAQDREDLRRLLTRASGGVVFTTIQKFLPEPGQHYRALTERENVVVIADEAHRSQYDFIDGFARHMRDALPNASFVGFTGTPIEAEDRDTRAVFGNYISTYDILQAVEDGATVPIYYEGRLARVGLDEDQKQLLDQAFDEVTEGEEVQRRERLRTAWARLEAIVGTPNRLAMIAEDLVEHFDARFAAMEGKAMVVGMSRRICVDLYEQLISLRPEWHNPDDAMGAVKVVMTGSAADPTEWQPHIRSKSRRDAIAERFKNPDDLLKIVIVRDMWLTGFDVPSLHTMYVDKPMRGHGLMQAIARVNRVFRDKPGGLIVDYLGLGDQLKLALGAYTLANGRGNAAIDQAEAVAIMQEKYEIVNALFHGFDYSEYFTNDPARRLEVLAGGLQHILALEDGKTRLLNSVAALSKAFVLAVPHPHALEIRDRLIFFQEVRGALTKTTSADGKPDETLNFAVRQLVSNALVPEGIVDIFTVAGLHKPDISILSEEFLAEIRDLPQKNLAAEVLQRLLDDAINVRAQRRLVEGRSFREMLEHAVTAYHNRAIETAQLIEQLIQLAKDLNAAHQRGEQLGLSEEELAFYDALEANDSAVKVLGDDTLRAIARELVESVRRNTTIDWNVRESARAHLRVLVKRILRKHGYPPDKQEAATLTVLKQAELFSDEWAAAAA